jgi:hypothetical protein
MIKNSGPVLLRLGTAPWIVAAPENMEEFFVGNLLRVIVYLNGLGVITQTVIIRIRLRSPCVPHTRPNHAFDAAEPGIRAPESPHGKRSGFYR